MILIGQFDSFFVRRVGVALSLYGLPFTHQPWSAFGDASRVATFNPLRRVPTLVLDDGTVLIDSTAILDDLDHTVGPERALMPMGGPGRRRALQACALSVGLADKAVALVYERILHRAPATAWVERCTAQMGDTLAALEASRAASATAYWLGETIGHADIALACALSFLREAHPRIYDAARFPALEAHAARCEALDAFNAVRQPFIPPAA